MGSSGQNVLPVIHFSEVQGKPGSPEWERARSQVKEALAEFGCFETTFNGVPVDLKKVLQGSLMELFDFPQEKKLMNSADKPYQGYFRQSDRLPLFESFGINGANAYDQVDGFIKIFWPKGNPKFSEAIQSFSEKLTMLDQIIRGMIVESLGLEKYKEEHLNSTNYHLRVMRYEGPMTNDTKLGIPGHTDKNMTTILCQNHVDGLELKMPDGDWVPFKPSTPESFVVMGGDSLHAWTNGRLCSQQHRVMMRGNDTRYSVGLFSIPKDGYIIKAPNEMVDDEHPQLFKAFDYVGFVDFFKSEAGLRAEYPLKAYCGV